MTLNEFMAAVQNRLDTNPTRERYGQAVYNVAVVNNLISGSDYDIILESDLDPFYNNDNVRAFVAWLISNSRLDIGLI